MRAGRARRVLVVVVAVVVVVVVVAVVVAVVVERKQALRGRGGEHVSGCQKLTRKQLTSCVGVSGCNPRMCGLVSSMVEYKGVCVR